jgi:uncharacterized delta-60 repeat protein
MPVCAITLGSLIGLWTVPACQFDVPVIEDPDGPGPGRDAGDGTSPLPCTEGDGASGDCADELVTTALPGGVVEPTAVAIQRNGKVLVAASTLGEGTGKDMVLLRYRRNGTLDPSFGTGGIVVTDFFGGDDQAMAIALQDDGSILVAGSAVRPGTHSDFAVARYTPHGALDTCFGDGGKVTTDFFVNTDFVHAIAVQEDGAIVVAGGGFNWNTRYDLAVARYTPDGALDPSFAEGGTFVLDTFGESNGASGMVLLEGRPEPLIVLAGQSFRDERNDMAVVALTRDGALHPDFGDWGQLFIDFSDDDAAHDMTLLPDGDLVAAGHAIGVSLDFALARFDAQGEMDGSFGDQGRVQTDFGGTLEQAFDVTALPDGRIFVVGLTHQGTYDLALALYQADGTLDASFGQGGLLAVDVAGGADRAWDAALDSDGRLAVSGVVSSTSGGEPDRIALARYELD